MFGNLWKRTKKVATMYTGTFVVVMFLNQLLFFGFCLNPVCLIAAMPHVLFITVIVGTWINKNNDWGSDEVAEEDIKKTARAAPSTVSEIDRILDESDIDLIENYTNNNIKGESPPWLDEVQPWTEDEISNDDDYYWVGEKYNIIEEFKKYGVFSIWHMTHRGNIEEILAKGILSNHLAYQRANPIDISDHDVQRWREQKDPIYGRKLHAYSPTYINIKNPMLYTKQNIYDDLCIIEISLSALLENEFIFTDGNAASHNTSFYNKINDLDKLPWDVLNATYWNGFPEGKRKRCSEVLIYPLIHSRHIIKLHCCSNETFQYLTQFRVPIEISTNLFFRKRSLTVASKYF